MSIINNDYLVKLINEQLQKKNKINSPLLRESPEIPAPDPGVGGTWRHGSPPGHDAWGRDSTNAEPPINDVEDILAILDAIDTGITVISLVVTGGVGTAVYQGAKLGVKQLVKIGLKKFGRKGLEKRIRQQALNLRLRKKYMTNPSAIRRKIKHKLRGLKKNPVRRSLGMAFTGAKYGITGAALVYWEDTLKAVERSMDLWQALQEQQMAAKISGNKARVAAVVNDLSEHGPELNLFIKSFFCLFSHFQLLEGSKAERMIIAAEDGTKLDRYKNPNFWRLDTDNKVFSVLSKAVSKGLNFQLNYSWYVDHDGNRVDIKFEQPGGPHPELDMGRLKTKDIEEQYMRIYNGMRNSLTKSLDNLEELYGDGESIDYILVSENEARVVAAQMAENASRNFEASLIAGEGNPYTIGGLNHPLIFVLMTVRILRYSMDFSNKFSIEQLSKLFDHVFDDDNYLSRLGNFDGVIPEISNLPTEEERIEALKKARTPFENYGDEDHEEELEHQVPSEELYMDLDAGVTGTYRPDNTVTVKHRSGAADLEDEEGNSVQYQHQHVDREEGTIYLSTDGASGKTLENLIYKLRDRSVRKFSRKFGKEKFFDIFQDFGLTILLDPSGKGIGGYQRIKECREWYDSSNWGEYKQILPEVGIGSQLLAELIFYYNETYLEMAAAGSMAFLYSTVKGTRAGVPKVLKYGSWQNVVATLAIVLPLAFWDPLNKL